MMLPLSSHIKPGMKGAFYGRHSTNKQTMDTQRTMAIYFAERYGCTVEHEYTDPSVSARKKKIHQRPGLTNLINDAKEHKFDLILIQYHDRLARNAAEHEFLRKTFEECDIPVVIISTESMYNFGDKLTYVLKDSLSEVEVEITRERTRATAKSITMQGGWAGGKAPFGYRYDQSSETFSQIENELNNVRCIFDLYRNQEGFQSVANLINRKFSRRMDKHSVRLIITNPFYAGYVTHGRKADNSRNTIMPFENWTMVKSSLIEPIMSYEQWQETWLIYEQRKTGELNPKMYKTSFYLSNLVTCTRCNNLLECKDQTTFDEERNKVYGNKWYRCPSCKYKIEADRLHTVIDALLTDLKSQNLEKVSSLVYEKLLRERQLVAEKLNTFSASLNDIEKQLQLVEASSSTSKV